MRPRKGQKTLEIFKVRLEEIINKTDSLVRLSGTMKWKELEEKLSKKYIEKMGAPGKETRGNEYFEHI
ncbi:hypothetical protein C0389_02415 [bacterium]|nr:hypothetical protein [bacterium]